MTSGNVPPSMNLYLSQRRCRVCSGPITAKGMKVHVTCQPAPETTPLPACALCRQRPVIAPGRGICHDCDKRTRRTP